MYFILPNFYSGKVLFEFKMILIDNNKEEIHQKKSQTTFKSLFFYINLLSNKNIPHHPIWYIDIFICNGLPFESIYYILIFFKYCELTNRYAYKGWIFIFYRTNRFVWAFIFLKITYHPNHHHIASFTFLLGVVIKS
jgi:hypothetical protein